MNWTEERLPRYEGNLMFLEDGREVRYFDRGPRGWDVKEDGPFKDIPEAKPICSGLSAEEMVQWLIDEGASLGGPVKGGE